MRGLQIELLKLNRLANYIILGLIILITAGTAATSFHTLGGVNTPGGGGATVLLVLSRIQSPIINFILAVFIIMNIGKEYSDNTLRRSIIDGFTRDEFFRSKLWIMILCVALFYVLENLILFTGGLISGHTDVVKDYLTSTVLINRFVRLLSVGIMAFFLIFLTRSIPISIVVYFVWNIVETIIIGLEKLWGGLNFDIQNYLPLSSIDTVLNSNEMVETATIVTAIGYLLIMLMLSYILLIKRDIK